MANAQIAIDHSQGAATITRLMKGHRSILSGPIMTDRFLSQVGQQTASHKLLANSTQLVYGRQVAFLDAVLKDYMPSLPRQPKVLDWGCGKGHITYLLKERGIDVISCDLARPIGDSAFGQEIPIIELQGIRVVPLDHASELPFADESFDCVVSFGVLEHVSSDTVSLTEVRRVLRKGGLLFITFLPYFLSWTQALARLRGDHYHDRLYSKSRLQSLAAGSNFQLAGCFHGQLFPKNSMPIGCDRVLEPLDRFLCNYTPLRCFATNLEALLVAM
jgi:SAM-dependent methyltransferase